MAGAIAPDPATTRGDRLGRLLERDDGVDFPFYDGDPVAISGLQWAGLLVSVAVGFLALTFAGLYLPGIAARIVPPLLFTAIPLATLALITRDHWTALFRRVGLRDIGLMVLFAALNIVIAFVVALIVSSFTTTAPNPTAPPAGADTIVFLVATAIQLLGEELLVILPFLALMHVLVARLGWSRKSAVLLAWFLTGLLFGAAHLPTYDWHVIQALVVIGASRIALTAAYVRTKNLWVSTGAHIINDWTLFLVLGQALH